MSMPRILSVSFDNLSGIARNAMLAHGGYAVSPATSTTRAFELLDKLRFDLVIIGATVPEAERRLLYLEIKRKYPEVPVMLMNAGELDPMIRARAHVSADVAAEDLMKTVASIVPIRQARKPLERRAVPR
jgi:DNA-binding NtrC family response regulator